MNITDLTPGQLRRAAAIKEKLDALSRELRSLLDGTSTNGAPLGKKRTISAAVKRKNRGCAAGAMGEGEARLNYQLSQFHHHFKATV